MPKLMLRKCDNTCPNLATKVVVIQAYVREGDTPIQMMLDLYVCDSCIPRVEFISPKMWDVLDTWALQGDRRALVDRSLTKIVGVPLGSPDLPEGF